MPLFDAYLMVDWSAKNKPSQGKDSIWLGLVCPDRNPQLSCPWHGLTHSGQRLWLSTPETRGKAVAALLDALTGQLKDARVLVGWDFAFSYPRGTARALGGEDWRSIWKRLQDDIEDNDDTNESNRFDVANALNKSLTGEAFPFWGHTGKQDHPYLHGKKPRPPKGRKLPERRLAETHIPKAQPVWKLAYTGSVGSQVLVGIPRVDELREHRDLKSESSIWPFETGLKVPDTRKTRIVHAEIYPSIVEALYLPLLPKDAGQVAALGRYLAALDAKGLLARLFELDRLTGESRKQVEREEGWILGADEDGNSPNVSEID